MQTITVENEVYVWATDLARERDIHQRSVYLAIDNGHLPSVKTAGRVWVRKAEADNWFPKSGPGRPKKDSTLPTRSPV